MAKKVGVGYILKAGGAQAVAAMAYGTETCPKVITRRHVRKKELCLIERICLRPT